VIQDPFKTRLGRIREFLDEQKLDLFFVAVPENRFYLSGYEADDLQLTESSGYLLISRSKQLLLTDSRYEEAAKAEAPGFELIIYSEGLAQVLPGLFAELKVERLGVEGHHVTYRKYKEIEEALRESRPDAVTVVCDDLVERLRLVKEPLEMERIRASLALTESALDAVWGSLAPGRKEKDLAWEIERHIREGGGEAVSFPPIVACGPNAALPHAVPTERRISPGDPVILDLGSRLNHYCSDMTRTWVAGAPEKRLKEIYQIVREAQLAAQNACAAGKQSTEVDAAARDLIRGAGYGDYFGHGLGHGVGIAVHEKPGLRRHQPVVLEENMVVTIEPGIYLPGFGGVRLENMVRVTRTGCELLNRLDLFYSW
jgi:Xaa-Pro aminopeptidase